MLFTLFTCILLFILQFILLFYYLKVTHIYTDKICLCVCVLWLLCTPATLVSKCVTVTVPVISGKQEHLVS